MKISELVVLDRILDSSELSFAELYLGSKWAIGSGSTPKLYDHNQSSIVYEDQSGGDRPFFFYGASQNNQNLFGSSLEWMEGPILVKLNYWTEIIAKFYYLTLPYQTSFMHGGLLMVMAMIIPETKNMVSF